MVLLLEQGEGAFMVAEGEMIFFHQRIGGSQCIQNGGLVLEWSKGLSIFESNQGSSEISFTLSLNPFQKRVMGLLRERKAFQRLVREGQKVIFGSIGMERRFSDQQIKEHD